MRLWYDSYVAVMEFQMLLVAGVVAIRLLHSLAPGGLADVDKPPLKTSKIDSMRRLTLYKKDNNYKSRRVNACRRKECEESNDAVVARV
jgi:hypothetical protein